MKGNDANKEVPTTAVQTKLHIA